MSTKVSIKWRDQREDRPGFHLYEDALDSLGVDMDDREAPVYLRVDGVSLDLHTLAGGGASVTVALPREAARSLGLLQPPLGPLLTQDSTRKSEESELPTFTLRLRLPQGMAQDDAIELLGATGSTDVLVGAGDPDVLALMFNEPVPLFVIAELARAIPAAVVMSFGAA
jgi:hypothetical protein